MKIIIDIDEDMLTEEEIEACIKLANTDFSDVTVLQKGHGDLIDRDKLEKDTEWDEYEDGCISYSHHQIFSAPVVIPADKGDLDNEDSN